MSRLAVGFGVDEYTDLQGAIVNEDDLATIRELIASSLDLDETDEYGDTAMHYAVSMERDDVVDTLLEAGANLEARDMDGRTPYLKYIMEYRDTDNLTGMLGHLIMKGCDRAAADKDGWNSLFYSASGSMPTMMGMLLELGGVEIDARSSYGTTAIFHANPCCLKLLLLDGADMSIRDEEGFTAQESVAIIEEGTAYAAEVKNVFEQEKVRRYHLIGCIFLTQNCLRSAFFPNLSALRVFPDPSCMHYAFSCLSALRVCTECH